MPQSILRSTNNTFKSRILESYDLIAAAHVSAIGKKSIISLHQRDLIVEYAFLRIWLAWEKFLEDAFVAYMTGRRVKGVRIKRFVKPLDEEHALRIISGYRDYPDWTRIDQVYKLAETFFDDPALFITPLKQIELHLNESKKIRNAIVHMSSNAQGKFLGLVRTKLVKYSSDITPGQFLGIIDPNSIPPITFFEFYTASLEFASDEIVFP